MNAKALQIMLVLAALLCAVGIAATLGRGGGATMPADFHPPGWLRSLKGLAGGPRLTARELTRNGRAFPAELRLASGEAAAFSVATAKDADVRRAEFSVHGSVHIQYRPVSGQRLGGKPVRVQDWPSAENRGAEPSFVFYDRGGAVTIRNQGPGTARIGLKD